MLGRIYILTGRPIKGKNCFDKAKVLGADQDDVDKMIVNTLEKAGKEDQRKAAKHFYDTEPERYQWVKRYLK